MSYFILILAINTPKCLYFEYEILLKFDTYQGSKIGNPKGDSHQGKNSKL